MGRVRFCELRERLRQRYGDPHSERSVLSSYRCTGEHHTINGVDRMIRRYALRDRKSTRLNSSHGYISYAVFCLKKKKKQIQRIKVRYLLKMKDDISKMITLTASKNRASRHSYS